MTDHEFLEFLVERAEQFLTATIASSEFALYRSLLCDAVAMARIRLNQQRRRAMETTKGET